MDERLGAPSALAGRKIGKEEAERRSVWQNKAKQNEPAQNEPARQNKAKQNEPGAPEQNEANGKSSLISVPSRARGMTASLIMAPGAPSGQRAKQSQLE